MEYKLEDIFDLQMGKTPSRNNPVYWESNDNKWISIADLSKCGKYIDETKEYLSDAAVNESGISLIPANTVVMSFKLSIGKTAITAEPMYSNEAIMSFIDKRVVKMIPDYIYYMFLGKDWDVGTNKAVMGKTLNKATLSKIKVNIHDIDKQREIVSVLDKVSNIIEKRQTEINKLDALIKARFAEMFGDVSYSDKRIKLTELCTKITDGEHGSVKRVQEGYPFLNAKHVKKNGLIDWDSITYVSEEDHRRIYKRCNPEQGDILLTTTGTIGNVAVVPRGEEFSMDRGITLLKLDKQKVTSEFVSELLKCPFVQNEMGVNVHASAIGHLFMNKVKNLSVIMPDIRAQRKFSSFVEQVDKSKVIVQKALDETQMLFDSLMQEYFG